MLLVTSIVIKFRTHRLNIVFHVIHLIHHTRSTSLVTHRSKTPTMRFLLRCTYLYDKPAPRGLVNDKYYPSPNKQMNFLRFYGSWSISVTLVLKMLITSCNKIMQERGFSLYVLFQNDKNKKSQLFKNGILAKSITITHSFVTQENFKRYACDKQHFIVGYNFVEHVLLQSGSVRPNLTISFLQNTS